MDYYKHQHFQWCSEHVTSIAISWNDLMKCVVQYQSSIELFLVLFLINDINMTIFSVISDSNINNICLKLHQLIEWFMKTLRRTSDGMKERSDWMTSFIRIYYNGLYFQWYSDSVICPNISWNVLVMYVVQYQLSIELFLVLFLTATLIEAFSVLLINRYCWRWIINGSL